MMKRSLKQLVACVLCCLMAAQFLYAETYLEVIDAAQAAIEARKGKVSYEPAIAKLKSIVDSNLTEEEKIAKIKREFSLNSKANTDATPGVAQDETPDIGEKIPPKKIDWLERSKFGSKGNVTVYVNRQGIPYEVYVIGVAPISTTMVAVEAEEDAREEAEFNAKAAFAIWMHEHFAVKNEREKKTIVVRTNGEEQSETTAISKRKATQIAEGMWRGMSVYWTDMGAKQKGRCTMVWRWSIKESELARMVEILTQGGDPDALDRKPDMKIKEHSGFRQ